MSVCRVMSLFVVFEKFVTRLIVLGAKLSSRDQVGCQRSLPEDQNAGIQGSLAVSIVRQPSRRPLAPLDSWILVFGEAALAADLITA